MDFPAMKKKLLFAFFEKPFLYALAVALLFYLIPVEQYHTAANFIVHLFLLLFFIKTGIIIHEGGHALAGMLIRERIWRIIIGTGEELYRFKWKGIPVLVYSQINSGAVLPAYQSRDNLRVKHFIVTMGGPLANLICLLCFLAFFMLSGLDFLGVHGLKIVTPFMFANLILVVTSLLPYYLHIQGVRVPTDGLSLLTIFFKCMDQLEKVVSRQELFEAQDAYEKKEYEAVLTIYSQHLEKNLDDLIAKYTIANLHLKLDDFGKMESLLKQIYGLLNQNKTYRALINNALAWLYLLYNDEQSLQLADHYSQIAYNMTTRDPSVNGTRGSVLIEQGKIIEGLNLLYRIAKLEESTNNSLCASMYVALANYKRVPSGRGSVS